MFSCWPVIQQVAAPSRGAKYPMGNGARSANSYAAVGSYRGVT